MMRIALFMIMCLVPACGSLPGEPRELMQILEARARWEAQGLRHYDFSFSAGCAECLTIPLRIQVRNAVVARAINEATGDTIGAPAWAPTIDTLYAWVLRDREDDACGRQTVRIDPVGHYPQSVQCSGVPRIADSGHWWNVSGFLPRTPGA